MGAAADEELALDRLDRLHPLAEARIVDRSIAPAEQDEPFGGDAFLDDRLDFGARRGVARHEELADRVMAGRRQRQAELFAFAGEKGMRNLRQDAAAVAELRVGADGAAVVEIDEDCKPFSQDGVRVAAVHVGHDADAAGIALVRRIVEALGARRQRIGAARRGRANGESARLERVAAASDFLGHGVHLSTPSHGRAPFRPSLVNTFRLFLA